MPPFLAGPGQGLPLPQNLYPSQLFNAPPDQPSNTLALAPGQELPIPAGDWYLSLGQFCTLEFQDPVTGIFEQAVAPGWTSGLIHVTSDGFNLRVANRTACPVSASVQTYGSAYVQGTTTITPTPGTSTWLPIVGGQLAVSTLSTLTAGAGYGVPPLVLIPPPPPAAANANGVGGIQARAYATITSGTVSTVSMIHPGAGYPAGFIATLVPNPTDPNLVSGITNATVSFTLVGSGSLTGALCTNPGVALGNNPCVTLTVGGAGTNASLVCNILQTFITVSVTGAGGGYATPWLISAGGGPFSGTITNTPEFTGLAFRPRPLQPVQMTGIAGAGSSTLTGIVTDSGLFMSNPSLLQIGFVNTVAAPTLATLAAVTGGKPDWVFLQPAP